MIDLRRIQINFEPYPGTKKVCRHLWLQTSGLCKNVQTFISSYLKVIMKIRTRGLGLHFFSLLNLDRQCTRVDRDVISGRMVVFFAYRKEMNYMAHSVIKPANESRLTILPKRKHRNNAKIDATPRKLHLQHEEHEFGK